MMTAKYIQTVLEDVIINSRWFTTFQEESELLNDADK